MTRQTFIVISTPSTTQDLVQKAISEVAKLGDVYEQHYPSLFSEWYECPAVKTPTGRIIFGLDGILMFVKRGGKESVSEVTSQARMG